MIIHKLVLASLNSCTLGQGLQGIRKRCEIRNFLRKVDLQLEILLFQEHHMSLEDCFQNTSQLQFKGGVSIWNNSLYTTTGDRFFGGTGISLSRCMAEHLIDSDVCIEGRTQFITLDIDGIKFGLLNIYAQNVSGQRASFWNTLSHFSLPMAEWIVCGDFNITKLGEDRSG